MKTISRSTFTTVKTEGALLPPDLLQKIADGNVPGLQPQDYHLGPSERLNEAINRAWNRLLGVWQAFQEQKEQLDPQDNGFALTRDRWLRILFQELGYGRLLTQRAMKLPGKQAGEEEQSFPINHCWENVPIHMTSFRQSLDSRDPALRRSPHSLLQEFLNRSDEHQWGFVSNGLALRILRDNASLTRAAYVEFDLDAMLSGEQYADFSLLWLLCHQSRVETITPAEPSTAAPTPTVDDDAAEPQSPSEPITQSATCWLERWSQTAVDEGTRALDALRQGVQMAIEALGQGFLRYASPHGGNRALKAALQRGALTKQEYYRQLLRVVYRLIFLLVAEDRDLLLLPNTAAALQERYRRFYSVGRLRTLADARRGSPHPDLYRGLRLLFHQLRDGYAPLGLPALGSFLFSARATPFLDDADLTNYDLLTALRALTVIEQGRVRRAVDFKNLGAEELGSVYESLLELHPELNIDAATFALQSVTGSERKTTGSYYTPTSLITCLLDSALEPVVADRLAHCHSEERSDEESRAHSIYHDQKTGDASLRPSAQHDKTSQQQDASLRPSAQHDKMSQQQDASLRPSAQHDKMSQQQDASLRPSAQHDKTGQHGAAARHSAAPHDRRSAREAAILSIKVVDPACGSGHFLIAAANRLALHLARIRTGDEEPSPPERRNALRDVVHHCIHGVDINPMSVELCKVALWMETLDPGKPLGFLDRNIQCGNSLLGATPALLRRGIPDDAFKPILGDDKEYVSRFKKQNKIERKGQRSLFNPNGIAWRRLETLAACMVQVEGVDDSTVAAVRRQETLYEECTHSPAYEASRLWADAWCAAFVWVKKSDSTRHSEEANANEESRATHLRHSEEATATEESHATHLRHSEGATATEESRATLHRHSEGATATEESRVPPSRDSSPSAQNDRGDDRRNDSQPSGFPYPITEEIFRQVEEDPSQCALWLVDEIVRLREQYQFFHWHLAFPHIFEPRQDELANEDVTGWAGGFDVVLGNPPWDKIQPEELKFFAAMQSDIAYETNASKRKQLIAQLPDNNLWLHDKWQEHQRLIEAVSILIKNGGGFPLTSPGNLNTYRLFTELASFLLSSYGRAGLVVQSGLATDQMGKEFFAHMMVSKRIVRFLDFENRGNFFPGLHAQFRFALLTLTGKNKNAIADTEFGWQLSDVTQLSWQGRLIRLNKGDIDLFNPTSGTSPTFHSDRELRISRKIYSCSIHVYIDEHRRYANVEFLGELFNMTRDSKFFISVSDVSDINRTNSVLPLYEAKLFHQFDHRFATYSGKDFADSRLEEKQDATYQICPKSMVQKKEVFRRLARKGYNYEWLLGFRDISGSTNERTAIFSIFPLSAVGNTINLILGLDSYQAAMMLANANCFIFDYCCRQKVTGTHVNVWIMEQLPIIPYEVYSGSIGLLSIFSRKYLLFHVLELTYTAYDLQPFAQDCGYHGPPFRWDEERRFLLRCELDAAYFHLYGIARDDVAYILETFPIVKRKDLAAHGEYRTQRVILEIYDAMAAAMHTGQPSTELRPSPYQTRLDPPPADPAVAHPWDEQYLGPYEAPATWWRTVAPEPLSAADGVHYEPSTKSARVVKERTVDYTAVPVGQEQGGAQLGLLGLSPKVFPPPTGDDGARLKRVRTLATANPSEDQLRELTAFLADANSNIRWLAGATLLQRGGPLVLAVLRDFVHGAAAERLAVARLDLMRILEMLVQTAEAEAVRLSAQQLLAELG